MRLSYRGYYTWLPSKKRRPSFPFNHSKIMKYNSAKFWFNRQIPNRDDEYRISLHEVISDTHVRIYDCVAYYNKLSQKIVVKGPECEEMTIEDGREDWKNLIRIGYEKGVSYH
jgi:hypothetical protein